MRTMGVAMGRKNGQPTHECYRMREIFLDVPHGIATHEAPQKSGKPLRRERLSPCLDW